MRAQTHGMAYPTTWSVYRSPTFYTDQLITSEED